MVKLLTLLVFAFAVGSTALVGSAQPGTNRPDDSQGVYDEKKSLDVMAAALILDPDLKAHIILYRGRYSPVSATNANIVRIRNYLVEIHKLDPQRITFADGGRRIQPRSEIYKMPPGADTPKPKPDDLPADDPVQASKVDEFGAVKPEIENVVLDAFAEEIKNRVTDDPFVMVYRSRKGKVTEAQTAIARIKKYLVGKRGMSPDRLKITDAGVRDLFTVELWAVPPNTKP